MSPPTPTTFDSATGASSCPSCEADRFGSYCAECGERRLGRDDLSLLGFLKDAVREVASADSRIWRSFRSLLFRPGLLSEEYLAGRRRPSLGPVQLFLICNVAFFVILEFLPLHAFTTRLGDHFYSHPYGSWILGMEATPGVTFRELVQDPESFGTYSRTFDAVTAGLAKSLILLMIPGVAALLHVLHVRRRRYFVEHLVFATHFFAVALLSIVAAGIAVTVLDHGLLLVGLRLGASEDIVMGIFLFGFLLPWLIPGLRRFYQQSWGMSALKFMLFMVAFYWVVVVPYRLMLFLLTIRLI